jgi:hypothetical protein
MLDKIKELFKEGLGYAHLSGLLQQVANITNIVHVQYMKDGQAKNEAIDHICALLQTHKEVIVPEAPVEEKPKKCCNAPH